MNTERKKGNVITVISVFWERQQLVYATMTEYEVLFSSLFKSYVIPPLIFQSNSRGNILEEFFSPTTVLDTI